MRSDGGRTAPADAVILAGALFVVAAFLTIAAHVVVRGLPEVSLDFLTTAPRRSGRAGGIAPILVSTAAVTGLALAVAIPIALGIALLVTECLPRASRMAAAIRFCLAMLAAVPSIVFGLVGSVLFCEWLGLGFSILAGALTLACMVLPIVACVAEQALSVVPARVRQGGYALGLPRRRVVTCIVLPVAMPGIAAGVALGFGRAVAESAALIFTSGYVDRMPGSVFDSGRTLAVHIFDLAMNIPGGDARAFASATVLLVSVLGVIVLLGLLDRLARRQMGNMP